MSTSMTSNYGTLPTPTLEKAGKITSRSGVLRVSNCFVHVPHDEMWAVEHFGKFRKTILPGYACLGFDCGGVCIGLRSISLKAHPHECLVETKTQDHVFMLLRLLLFVLPIKPEPAFYGLADVANHLDAIVSSEVRREVSKMKVEQVFLQKTLILEALMRNIDPVMRGHGFTLCSVDVTQVQPAPGVLESLVELDRQHKLRAAVLTEVQESCGSLPAREHDSEVAGKFAEKCSDKSRITELLRIVQYLDSMKKSSLTQAGCTVEDAPEESAALPPHFTSANEAAPGHIWQAFIIKKDTAHPRYRITQAMAPAQNLDNYGSIDSQPLRQTSLQSNPTRGLCFCCNSLVVVPQDQLYAVEHHGKFVRTLTPGLSWVGCDCLGLRYQLRSVTRRVEQFDVLVEAKTKDDIFVLLRVTVQQSINPREAEKAFYSLDGLEKQVASHVTDAVTAHLPSKLFNEAFESLDSISRVVLARLRRCMTVRGFEVHNALITELKPRVEVVTSMNEAHRQKRLCDAAAIAAEAEKIRIVAKAAAEARVAELQGQAVAKQTSALLDGLRDSLGGINGDKMEKERLSELLLIIQYYELLKEQGVAEKLEDKSGVAAAQLQQWLQSSVGLEPEPEQASM